MFTIAQIRRKFFCIFGSKLYLLGLDRLMVWGQRVAGDRWIESQPSKRQGAIAPIASTVNLNLEAR
jgi:hypothetical protein